jgi:hypothetical protein
MKSFRKEFFTTKWPVPVLVICIVDITLVIIALMELCNG